MKEKESPAPFQHAWNLTPEEAITLQKQLQPLTKLTPLTTSIQYVGGADIAYNKFSDTIYSGIVVLDYETLEIVTQSFVTEKVPFPYIPGLLSFREIPSLIHAYEQLDIQPDIMVFDGHGIAHPRRLGVATHFGILTNTPTIGNAKKNLTGIFEIPAPEKGSYAPIQKEEETIGYALRTRDNVKPIFVSPGHLCTLEDSIQITLKCTSKYRIPEPTRQADIAVNQLRMKALTNKD